MMTDTECWLGKHGELCDLSSLHTSTPMETYSFVIFQCPYNNSLETYSFVNFQCPYKYSCGNLEL